MQGTLRDRLVKGLGAQGYGQAVNVLIQIATVPLLIYVWGVELYGEWLILSAMPVYLTMSDVGFGNAAQNEMTMAAGRGDRSAVVEALQSVWLLVAAVSVVVFVVVAGAASLLPVADWFDLTALGSRAVTVIILLLSLQVLVSLQTGLVYSGFHCKGRYGLGQFLMANIRLLEFALLVVAVVAGGGPTGAAAALLAGRVMGTVAMRTMLWRVNPEITFGWRHARRETIRRLAGPALGFMAFPFGNALNLQGMVILVGAVLGPPAVAVFATLRTLTRFGLQLVSAVNRTVQAEISAAYGKGDSDLQRRLHHLACQAALCATVATALALAVFGSWILALWTDGAVGMDRTLFYLLLAVLITHGMWHASLMLAFATNRHQGIAL
ncbi:MAG: hypothetical protein V3U93_05850, partial [Alphaproteobacteria bacterium]